MREQKFELWDWVRPTIPVISDSKDPIAQVLEVRVERDQYRYLVCFDPKSWEAIYYDEQWLEPLTPVEQLARMNCV